MLSGLCFSLSAFFFAAAIPSYTHSSHRTRTFVGLRGRTHKPELPRIIHERQQPYSGLQGQERSAGERDLRSTPTPTASFTANRVHTADHGHLPFLDRDLPLRTGASTAHACGRTSICDCVHPFHGRHCLSERS